MLIVQAEALHFVLVVTDSLAERATKRLSGTTRTTTGSTTSTTGSAGPFEHLDDPLPATPAWVLSAATKSSFHMKVTMPQFHVGWRCPGCSGRFFGPVIRLLPVHRTPGLVVVFSCTACSWSGRSTFSAAEDARP